MRQNYQISEQFPSPQEEEALGFPVFLLQDYVNLFNSEKSICPLIIRDTNNQLLAFWIFQEENDCWFSPVSAPFSCPKYFGDINFKNLLQESKSFLRAKSNKPIRFVWNSLFSGQEQFQFSKIVKVEINHFMRIDKDRFAEKLPQKRRKQKLRALKRRDFVVEQIGIKQWEKIYQQNLEWRIEKGHENYIPLGRIIQFKSAFPNNYLGFQLIFKNQLIGNAFVVRVSAEYLYLYSLITNPAFDNQELSLLLYESIYEYAKSNKIKLLDLGTSMDSNGNIHKNIARFKKEIGASAIRKYTFEC
ncbi:MAG TPA: hypothetical protein VFM92_13350 [Marivirga sp.]|nr:hypothetical protein [Marivirga sp.]